MADNCSRYPDFDKDQYILNYKDIADVVKKDPSFNTFDHWCMNGRGEKRTYKQVDRYGKEYKVPSDWNAEQYAINYPEIAKWGSDYPLSGMGKVNVLDHYAKFGQYEGRLYIDINVKPADWDPDQYLLNYKDLVDAGVDPWQHYRDYGREEGRTYKVTDARGKLFTVPSDWDAAQYAENYPQIATWGSDYPKPGQGKVSVLDHYAKWGQYSKWSYLKPAPPVDWEDEAYLILYPDIANSVYNTEPVKHYCLYGMQEGRIYCPPGWSSAEYLKRNPDVAASADYGTKPLTHYWKYGKAEHRSYMPFPPIAPGLQLVIDNANSGKEFFSSLRIPEGLLIGEYGLWQGGPNIYLYNGELKQELNIPDVESVMKILDVGDGQPLAFCEHYAKIFKRNPDGTWTNTYRRNEQDALILGAVTMEDGMTYAFYNRYTNSGSGFLQSGDKGRTWSSPMTYSDKEIFGIGQGMYNGKTEVLLTGSMGGYPIGYPMAMDAYNRVQFSVPGAYGYGWWGNCNDGGIWNFGTWQVYEDNKEIGCKIHVYDGSVKEVFSCDRAHIHTMGIYEGKRYAVATWDWSEDSGKTSLLLSSPTGYNWSIVCEIPCAHIIGMTFADGGAYFTGGKFQEYGRLYFYKF